MDAVQVIVDRIPAAIHVRRIPDLYRKFQRIERCCASAEIVQEAPATLEEIFVSYVAAETLDLKTLSAASEL